MSEVICDVCPHACHLRKGQTGFCKARKNFQGNNLCVNYGKITSLAIDPIEKKPLAGYYPGSLILSAGSFGCNLACPFCQNHEISMHGEDESWYKEVSPKELADLTMAHPESIGLAFTYNEPLIGWEYIRDTAEYLSGTGKKIVLVTNGCVNLPVLERLMPYIDAMNIDLKGDREFYRELRGDYDTVKQTIAYAAKHCHVEITTLVVPGKNDSDEFIRQEAEWLASLDPGIILHLTRYFPRYHYTLPPTDIDVLRRLQKTASVYLKDVRLGNV